MTTSMKQIKNLGEMSSSQSQMKILAIILKLDHENLEFFAS